MINEYLLMIAWIAVIGVEVYVNWHEIEVKKEYHKHWLWAIPRVIFGFGFMYFFSLHGYYWYWTALFLLTTHMFLFPEALNLARNKDFGYLGDPDPKSQNKSLYDKMLQKVVKTPAIKVFWLFTRFILLLFGVGNMILQAKCSWFELNHGGCL